VLLRERADDDRPFGHALVAERVEERPAVEEEALHRGVVDQEEVVLAAEVADEPPVLLVERAARGHGRAHEEHPRRSWPDRGGERVAVEVPLAAYDLEGD
jgi:hypothetical protein